MKVYHKVQLVGFDRSCSESGGLQLAVSFETSRRITRWEANPGLMYGNLLCLSPGGRFHQGRGFYRKIALLKATGVSGVFKKTCIQNSNYGEKEWHQIISWENIVLIQYTRQRSRVRTFFLFIWGLGRVFLIKNVSKISAEPKCFNFGSSSGSSPVLPLEKMGNFLVQLYKNCTSKVIGIKRNKLMSGD